MTETFTDSSDSARSAKPLKHAEYLHLSQPLDLELGARLREITVCYETYGTLSAARDNAVLICHALSGDSHVARHDPQDDIGWWEVAVGPGKAIDTDKYFAICPNIFGGCRGTTGPNCVNPSTGKTYGNDFPTITIGDMVEVQKRLVEHFGIQKLLAVVGGSMGGQQVLCWSVKLPHMVGGAVALATAGRLSTQALAFDVVGRNAILSDPNFNGGHYLDKGMVPARGLAIARMIGHITYLSPEAMQQKFEADRLRPRDVPTEFEKLFSVGSYLGYQGDKFVDRFDANSYVTLTTAMDLFDMGRTVDELRKSLSPSKCRYLVVSFSSDWLFAPSQSQEIVNALLACGKSVSYCNVESACGHDAFLLNDELATYGELMRSFLANGEGRKHFIHLPAENNLTALSGEVEDLSEPAGQESPTSILNRLDYQRILELVPPNASVLDLGCGAGTLLSHLRRRGNPRLLGLELQERAILACVHRGLDVLQADLNEGLSQFAKHQFDCVVLSQTLQAVRDVEHLVADMLRVGRQCIVSFPNFGYHKIRAMLSEKGRAPESTGLLRYKWYNTPNIRFFTIADFEDFCREKEIHVHRRIALDTEADQEVHQDANLKADLAIFVISA